MLNLSDTVFFYLTLIAHLGQGQQFMLCTFAQYPLSMTQILNLVLQGFEIIVKQILNVQLY